MQIEDFIVVCIHFAAFSVRIQRSLADSNQCYKEKSRLHFFS
jgi:hypothetical protein